MKAKLLLLELNSIKSRLEDSPKEFSDELVFFKNSILQLKVKL
jgi:hypothetical protein